MNKNEKRTLLRQTAEKAVIRDELNRRMQFAATNCAEDVLKNLHTTLRGLDEEEAAAPGPGTGQCGTEPDKIRCKPHHPGETEVSVSAAGRYLCQSLHCNSVLPGPGVGGYGHDFSPFFPVRKHTGGF